MNEMLKNKIWAVVGANDNPDKFGYMIYKKLKDSGYEVYPVNPKYNEIEGDKCYPSLSNLPNKPQAVDMVVSPKNGMQVIDEAANLGIKNIWFQPGTTDETILNQAESKGMNIVQSCVLKELD
jgi:predicted CoA-binding protein